MFFLYNINNISDENTFENLIKEILLFRDSNLDIKDYFKNKESDFVKSYVSAMYFFRILEKFDILEINSSISLANQSIVSPARRDSTSININLFELKTDNIDLIDSMLTKYSIFEESRKSELPSELISEIYNFIDKDIYEILDIEYEIDYSLANDIYNYSINPDKWNDFEIKVNEAINMFYNIKSEVV